MRDWSLIRHHHLLLENQVSLTEMCIYLFYFAFTATVPPNTVHDERR